MINETYHSNGSKFIHNETISKNQTHSKPTHKTKSKFPTNQILITPSSHFLYDKNNPNKEFYDEFLASIKEEERQFKLFTPKNNERHRRRTKKHKNSNTSSVNSIDGTIKSNISIDKEVTNMKKMTQSCFKNQSNTPMMFQKNKPNFSIINNENIEVISPKKNSSVNPKNFSSTPAAEFFLQYCGIRNLKKGVDMTVSNEIGRNDGDVKSSPKERERDTVNGSSGNILTVGGGGGNNTNKIGSENMTVNSNDPWESLGNSLVGNSHNDNAGCFLKMRNYSSIDSSKILKIRSNEQQFRKSPFLHEKKEEVKDGKEIPERISKIDNVAICHFHTNNNNIKNKASDKDKNKYKDKEKDKVTDHNKPNDKPNDKSNDNPNDKPNDKDKDDESSKKPERISQLSKKKRLWFCCIPIT